ncbi:MAG: hypothetical protein V1779_16970 [bacterium]
MKKGTKFFIAAIAMFIGLSMSSYAQLEAGSIGIGASFVSGSPTANCFYALNDNMEVGVGLGYATTSYDDESDYAPDAGSSINFTAMFKYFLSKGRDVSPFIGGMLEYNTLTQIGAEKGKGGLGFAAMFGGQAAIAKNLHVYGYVSLGYYSETDETNEVKPTYTTISLGGSGVGAIFYF